MNVALVAAYVRANKANDPTPAANTPAPAAAAEKAKRVTADAPLTAQTYGALTGGSLQQTIARLQAEGFPPRVIRAIVTALVDQQFADRHRQIADLIRSHPWWRPMWGERYLELLHQQQKLRHEVDTAVEDLLGTDPNPPSWVLASRRYRYGDLPLQKLAALDRMNGDYGELQNQIRAEAQGVLLPQDLEKLRYLAEQADADARAMLTPEEFYEYQLRSSPSAWWLRTQLTAFDPTPEEFRAIYRVQSETMAPFANGRWDVMTPEMREAAAKAGKTVPDKVRAVLTPERFAEYELKTDEAYAQTAPLIERWNLPATATADVVRIRKDIQQRAEAINANGALSAAARGAQLGALVDEANLRLGTVLGSERMAEYKQGAGRWLANLNPQNPKR